LRSTACGSYPCAIQLPFKNRRATCSGVQVRLAGPRFVIAQVHNSKRTCALSPTSQTLQLKEQDRVVMLRGGGREGRLCLLRFSIQQAPSKTPCALTLGRRPSRLVCYIYKGHGRSMVSWSHRPCCSQDRRVPSSSEPEQLTGLKDRILASAGPFHYRSGGSYVYSPFLFHRH
jgi:hypothetical protein